jgi:hypothetical protein
MTQMRKHLDELNARRRLRIPSIYHNNVKERFRPKGLTPRSREAGLYANPFLAVKPRKTKFSAGFETRKTDSNSTPGT